MPALRQKAQSPSRTHSPHGHTQTPPWRRLALGSEQQHFFFHPWHRFPSSLSLLITSNNIKLWAQINPVVGAPVTPNNQTRTDLIGQGVACVALQRFVFFGEWKLYVVWSPLEDVVRIWFSISYVSSVFGFIFHCKYHVIIHSPSRNLASSSAVSFVYRYVSCAYLSSFYCFNYV